uniref:uncharacterized protein LOC120331203 n=1 Tax=Styela clava TaxID=7725 RepID=UPI001939D058|nr:uncharacterized protein LOC120331203 [Styela clava]
MAPFRESIEAAKLPVNIVILGGSSVGKTAVTLQFINEKKVEAGSCPPTIEASFYKELSLTELSEKWDSEAKEEGVECLWKMDINSSDQQNSTLLRNAQGKHPKRKNSNNNELDTNEFKTMIKVTDTASFKRTYAPRKSLRQRLAQRLTPRRRPPVSTLKSPITRRYKKNFVESNKSMNVVPSFIYRKQDGKSTIHDEAIRAADAFILVYSVQDGRSFDTVQQIRDKILSVRGHPCASMERSQSPSPDNGRKKRVDPSYHLATNSNKRMTGLVGEDSLPPIAVVGTHIDVTAPTASPWSESPVMERKASNDHLLSSAFSFSPRSNGSRRRNVFQKQMSLAAEVLNQTHKSRGTQVSSEYVRGIVGSWQECVGFAEVSNNSVARLHRVFQHLTTRVIHRRTSKGKNKSLPQTPRKRLDSVLSILRSSRQSTPDGSESGKKSCWHSCFC